MLAKLDKTIFVDVCVSATKKDNKGEGFPRVGIAEKTPSVWHSKPANETGRMDGSLQFLGCPLLSCRPSYLISLDKER